MIVKWNCRKCNFIWKSFIVTHLNNVIFNNRCDISIAERENYLVCHIYRRIIYFPFLSKYTNIYCRIVHCRRRANLCTLEKNNIARVKFGTTALQNASRNWIFATRSAKYGRAKKCSWKKKQKPLSDSSCALEDVHRY